MKVLWRQIKYGKLQEKVQDLDWNMFSQKSNSSLQKISNPSS